MAMEKREEKVGIEVDVKIKKVKNKYTGTDDGGRGHLLGWS